MRDAREIKETISKLENINENIEYTPIYLKFIMKELTKLNALVANYIILCWKNSPWIDIDQLRKETKQILDPDNEWLYTQK